MKNLGWRIRQSLRLIEDYTGHPPLSQYLKTYFANNKKFGSRDRRELSQVVFSYFRLARALKQLPKENAIALAYYCCNECSLAELDAINSLIPSKLTSTGSLEEKVERISEYLGTESANQILPEYSMSEGLDRDLASMHILKRPDTFIRILHNRSATISELEEQEIPYSNISETCLAIGADKSLTLLDSFKRGYFYIQDWSSQRVEHFLHARNGEEWWDACAGAGGKSLLFLQKNPGAKIFASDIRPGILRNYQSRIKQMGFETPKTSTFNLEDDGLSTGKKYDGIILDVPCSGSGTWARSPERVFFFTDQDLLKYTIKQRRIVDNAIKHLKPGGTLVYITCSVFRDENEEQVNYITTEKGFTLEKMEVLAGFENKADHLFAARLSSPE